MAFLVCLLFRESIGVAITKSFVIFVRKFFVSSIYIYRTSCRKSLPARILRVLASCVISKLSSLPARALISSN